MSMDFIPCYNQLIMELKVGQKFSIDKYNTYTMTARNSTVNELWEVTEVNGEDVKAVLLSTNAYMYGGGHYSDFKDIREYRTNEGILYFH